MSAEWRPDPGGQFDYRWWDGQTWTDQVSRNGEVMSAPLQAAAPPPPPPQGADDGLGPAIAAGSDPMKGLKGDLFDGSFDEDEDVPAVSKQNGKLLRCRLGEPVMARRGAMVAYQGNLDFTAASSGGIGGRIKAAASGEGVPVMQVSGQGDIFFADMAGDVHIIELEDGALSANGRHVLAFSSSLAYDIKAISASGGVMSMAAAAMAGGLFNTVFTGTGWVAVATKGTPVVLSTAGAPTFVDKDALVAWSANLSLSVKTSMSGLGSLMRGGSGEAFQVGFEGDGFCIVQPSEADYLPAKDGSNKTSSGSASGALGKFLGG